MPHQAVKRPLTRSLGVVPWALLLLAGKLAAADEMSPFPDRLFEPSAPLARRERFIRVLDTAVGDALQDPRSPGLEDMRDLPLVIVALDADGARPLAGQHDFEMHYAGSLLKMAPLYAAYQLRESVNQLAETLDPAVIDSEVKFFRKVSDTFDRQIDASVPLIRDAPGVTPAMRVPKYAEIFRAELAGGKWRVDFDDRGLDNFSIHLRKMIVGSDNDSAGVCTRALGYSWINGVHQAAGFLDLGLTGREGIWLAGDYGRWTTVELPSVNDKKVKQVTTAFNMAWMLVLLHDKKLVKNRVNLATGQDGNDEMLRLLELATDHPGAPSLLKRVPIAFTVTHSKIGVGELKEDPNNRPTPGSCITARGCVYAEAAIVRHASGREYVVVWLNQLDGRTADLRRIAAIVQKTMDDDHP